MPYEANTPVEDVIAEVERRKACAEAVDWCRKFEGQTWNTVVQNADKDIDPEFDQSWSVWYLRLFGDISDTEIRKGLFKGIHDPMSAFMLYLKAEWLTDEEDRLLENKFKGRLPRAEAELEQGIVKRRKWL